MESTECFDLKYSVISIHFYCNFEAVCSTRLKTNFVTRGMINIVWKLHS